VVIGFFEVAVVWINGDRAQRLTVATFAISPIFPGNEISSLWQDGIEHAGHFVRRHALPIQMGRRDSG
jgi:hypothetical protein